MRSKKAPQIEGLEESLTLIALRASFLFPSLKADKSKLFFFRAIIEMEQQKTSLGINGLFWRPRRPWSEGPSSPYE